MIRVHVRLNPGNGGSKRANDDALWRGFTEAPHMTGPLRLNRPA